MTTLLRPAPVIDPPGTVRYLVLYGSHAHGTATPASDEDWRGVYQLPNDEFLGLRKPFGRETWQATADGSLTAMGGAVKWQPDVVLWELGHFCRMLLAGNPNIVGLLSAPDDCVADICPVIAILRSNRSLFVTRQMALAYTGWIESEMRHDPAVLTPKRLSHVVRLIHEMEGAARTGTVPVRLEGATLQIVRELKTGMYSHEAATEIVHGYVAEHLPILKAMVDDLPEAPREWVGDLLLRARHGDI